MNAQAKGGDMVPTRDGAKLTLAEWEILYDNYDDISAAIADANLSFSVDISLSRTITLAVDCEGASVFIPAGHSIAGDPEAPLRGIRLYRPALKVRFWLVCPHVLLHFMPRMLLATPTRTQRPEPSLSSGPRVAASGWCKLALCKT